MRLLLLLLLRRRLHQRPIDELGQRLIDELVVLVNPLHLALAQRLEHMWGGGGHGLGLVDESPVEHFLDGAPERELLGALDPIVRVVVHALRDLALPIAALRKSTHAVRGGRSERGGGWSGAHLSGKINGGTTF